MIKINDVVDTEKVIKELLKHIVDSNSNIPQMAKTDIKAIVEVEHNPERILQETMLYMLMYKC